MPDVKQPTQTRYRRNLQFRGIYAGVLASLLFFLLLQLAGALFIARYAPAMPDGFARWLEVFLAFSAVFASAAVLTYLRRVLRAVRAIDNAASRLAHDEMRRLRAAIDALGDDEVAPVSEVKFVPLHGDDSAELGGMVSSFNALQDELAAAGRGLSRAAARIAAARAAAASGERSKDEFLAMISHELRTPLNGVIGLSGLILDGTLDAQSRLYAKMLREAADHLLTMINDLLDLTKLEAEQLAFEEVPFDLDGLVQSVLDLIAPRAHAKGLEFGGYIDPALPPLLRGDPSRLRQVLINLLGNAVKFTNDGHVLLEVTRLDAAPGVVRLSFAVQDTGVGINDDDIGKLFAVFSQVDGSVSRRFGGSGLGLVISRRLARRMGGDITVQSEPGRGSLFRLTLPLVAVAPEEAPHVTPRGLARLQGERVLVLHRLPFGRSLLLRKIESRGGVVEAAESVAEAMSRLRAAASANQPFTRVLVDGSMSTAELSDLTARVRGDAALAGTRLVLVTWADQRSFAEDGRDVFDARLLRPVPADTLIYRLSGRDHGAERAGEAPVPAASAAGLRVLVAEDNHTNQVVIRAMLGKLGHQADLAGNGYEAVEALRRASYDVVLMDVMMPELDGLDATRLIRAMEQPKGDVPVILLTADVSAGENSVYREAGVNAVLIKPVTLETLRTTLLAHARDTAGAAPPGLIAAAAAAGIAASAAPA